MISMLRGINVGGHNQVTMDALRKLYESLNLREPQTYVQGEWSFSKRQKEIRPSSRRK